MVGMPGFWWDEGRACPAPTSLWFSQFPPRSTLLRRDCSFGPRIPALHHFALSVQQELVKFQRMLPLNGLSADRIDKVREERMDIPAAHRDLGEHIEPDVISGLAK